MAPRIPVLSQRSDIMTILHRASAGLVASGVLALGLLHADPAAANDFLVNLQTGKCLTIAGGTSPANNIEAVQFDCDSDSSRRWTLLDMSGGICPIRYVTT